MVSVEPISMIDANTVQIQLWSTNIPA